MSETITGKVVDVIDETHIVINKGADDGVTESQRFLVYRFGEEMTDPDTNESLGRLELVCGEGRPDHIQERITTLISCRTKTKKNRKVITRKSPSSFTSIFMPPDATETIEETPERVTLPFEDVERGYLFKQIVG